MHITLSYMSHNTSTYSTLIPGRLKIARKLYQAFAGFLTFNNNQHIVTYQRVYNGLIVKLVGLVNSSLKLMLGHVYVVYFLEDLGNAPIITLP